MQDGIIYFRDGTLIAKSDETRVYEMGGELFMEAGRNNLISSDGDLSDYIWQIGNKPYGNCLVVGLGLGIATKYILSLPKVDTVTVIEPNDSVINTQTLINPITDDRVSIINNGVLSYLYQVEDKYDFIFLDCYNIIDEDTLPFIADIVAASKKVLTRKGNLLGWLDNNTPEKFIEAFYSIFTV